MHKSREAIPCMHTSYYPISQINSFLWYDIWWYYIDYCLLTFLCRIGTYWFFSTDLLSKLCRPTFLPTLGDFLGYKNHLQLSNLVYNILTLSYIKFQTSFYYHNKMGAYTRQLIILSHRGQRGRPVWLPTAGIQRTRVLLAKCSLDVVHEVPRVLWRDWTRWAGPKQLVCLPLQVLHQNLQQGGAGPLL